MRHSNRTFKIGRTSSHRRCMVANILKSLIEHGRVETTLVKAKHLKRMADRLITLAKTNDLASRRRVIAQLMIQFNALTPKEERRARSGDHSAYNTDRRVITKLFGELGPRFKDRSGGYTRVVRLESRRRGDCTDVCVLEYLSA